MSDWWSRRLSGDAPAPKPVTNYPPPPAQPAERSTTTKAAHQRSQGVCPGCGGDNYFTTSASRPRCYDCGYPVEQQGSGLSGTNTGGTSKPARQVPSAGYQPTNFAAGRVQ